MFEEQIAKREHIKEKLHIVDDHVSRSLGRTPVTQARKEHAARNILSGDTIEKHLVEHIQLPKGKGLCVHLHSFLDIDKDDPALSVSN
jgi:hypothetical protein